MKFSIVLYRAPQLPIVRIHAGGLDQEGRAWPQLVCCAPYPSTCPIFRNEVRRTSNEVWWNSEGKATLVEVPNGLPKAWESPDMISGLRELVRKYIRSMGTNPDVRPDCGKHY
jgi:hypothetical protein